MFDQLRRKPDEPGKLAADWPPPSRDDVDDDTRGGPENDGCPADHYGGGGRFDDVVLELQLPGRIVCRTCAEATGQCVFKRVVFRDDGSVSRIRAADERRSRGTTARTTTTWCSTDERCGDSSGRLADDMRYRVSPTKRKRSRSRPAADRSGPQLAGRYDGDSSAVLLEVNVLDTPPAPVRHSSVGRFQTIIAQQQTQVR